MRVRRATSATSLMYIKEDLIIPHHTSFYDLIVSKARGKSGPLFHFDVHEDIRIVNDASREKDESHAGARAPLCLIWLRCIPLLWHVWLCMQSYAGCTARRASRPSAWLHAGCRACHKTG